MVTNEVHYLFVVDMLSRFEHGVVRDLRRLLSPRRARRDLEALRRCPLGWLLVNGLGGTGKTRFGVLCALMQTVQGLKGNLCAPTHVATTRLNDTVHDLIERMALDFVVLRAYEGILEKQVYSNSGLAAWISNRLPSLPTTMSTGEPAARSLPG
jgi:hypothetical protein